MTLIDSDALITKIVDVAHKINKSNADYSSKHFALCVLEDIERIIDEAPIIDPVKHGRWITQYDLDGNIEYYECTNCKFALLWSNDDALPKYCPECGARMEEDASK